MLPQGLMAMESQVVQEPMAAVAVVGTTAAAWEAGLPLEGPMVVEALIVTRLQAAAVAAEVLVVAVGMPCNFRAVTVEPVSRMTSPVRLSTTRLDKAVVEEMKEVSLGRMDRDGGLRVAAATHLVLWLFLTKSLRSMMLRVDL